MTLAASDIVYLCLDLVGDPIRPAALSTLPGDFREFIWDSSLRLSVNDWPKVAAEFHRRWNLNGSWR